MAPGGGDRGDPTGRSLQRLLRLSDIALWLQLILVLIPLLVFVAIAAVIVALVVPVSRLLRELAEGGLGATSVSRVHATPRSALPRRPS